MQEAAIEDLDRYVAMSALKAHARGWCVCVHRIDAEADAVRVSIWGVGLAGDAACLVEDGSPAACSEDGRWIAYLGEAGQAREVFLFDAQDGSSRQITRLHGNVLSIEQLDVPGKRALVTRREILVEGDAPVAIDFLPCKQDGTGIAGRDAVRLGAVDLATGEYSSLVDAGGDVLEARWDPQRRRLAWLQRRHGRQRHGIDLWLREGDGQVRRLAPELVSISSLAWSPDGSRIAVSGSAVEGDSLVWPYVIDLAGGQVRSYAVEMGTPGSIQWDEDGNRLWVVEARRGLQQIARLDLETGEVQPVYAQDQTEVQELARCGSATGFIRSDALGGPELWIASAEEAPRRVTHFNDWRDQRARLRLERRRFAVPDGDGGQEEIEGWLLLPPGSGPFPLLLDMHGGPQVPASIGYARHPHWPVLVQRGWAVLALNAVGSASYGAAFARRLRGRWGELDWPQWQAATATLQAEGIVSGEVAVFGHSYGGFLSAWALAHEPGLGCGVVSAGVINLESHAGTSDSGYYVSPYAMDGELPGSRERYRALSPLARAPHIAAPVLILQGLEDQRCPVGQAEELFSSLIRNSTVPARLIRFPGGDHHLAITGKPSHRRAYHQALVDWLEQWRGVRPLTAPVTASPPAEAAGGAATGDPARAWAIGED